MKSHTCPLIRRTLPAPIQSKSSVHARASVPHEDALESEPTLVSHPAVRPASAWVTLHKWPVKTRSSLWFVMSVDCCCLPSCSFSLQSHFTTQNLIKKSLTKIRSPKKQQAVLYQEWNPLEGRSSDRGRSELLRVPHICGPLFPRLLVPRGGSRASSQCTRHFPRGLSKRMYGQQPLCKGPLTLRVWTVFIGIVIWCFLFF